MTARERELCRDDMNHDFLTGVFNRRYFETEFCTRLDEWTDAHRCASLALVALDDEDGMRTRQGDAVMTSWSVLWPTSGKVLRPPCRAGGSAA